MLHSQISISYITKGPTSRLPSENHHYGSATSNGIVTKTEDHILLKISVLKVIQLSIGRIPGFLGW